MKSINELKMVFSSKSINEGFSRVAVSCFVSSLDPNIEELTDIKTAVSEAVTNAVVHGYREKEGKIYIDVQIFEKGLVKIKIRDKGVGIENVAQAMEPLFTTSGGERAGLGFAVMESFMDKVTVKSIPDKGTTVILQKRIRGKHI
ncbi:MAG: anti-sigma F factor [Acutalibacteraceae bacterium]